MQLKCAMLEKSCLKTLILDELQLQYSLQLPDNVPMSIISKEFIESAANENDIMSMDNIIVIVLQKLFLKYIDSSRAVLEINISSSTRLKLVNVFRNFAIDDNKHNSIQKILPLMERAVIEIAQLMNDSHQRFRRTKVFEELVSQN